MPPLSSGDYLSIRVLYYTKCVAKCHQMMIRSFPFPSHPCFFSVGNHQFYKKPFVSTKNINLGVSLQFALNKIM
jgi:hypothetical protein